MLTDNLGEELRVLYVALTRAKEKLIITASVKKLSETVAATLKDIPVLAAGTTAKNLLLPYSMRAGAGSYFDLILPSLIRHPSFEKALDKLELPKDEYLAGIDRSLPVRPLGEVCDKEDDTVYMPELAVDVLTEDEIISSLVKKDVSALARKQELLGESIAADEDLCKRLLIRFESKYAYENLKGLFTKTTVTELKKHMLEEMGETFDRQEDYGAEYEEEAEKEEKDQAVGEGPEKRIKKLTGAERGTAYHRIMEILDKDIYGDEEFMKAAADGGKADGSKEISKRIFKWMLGMKDKGFIPQEYLNCVYAPDIVTFLSTDLGQRMGRAYREGKLFREKPFMMGISARDLDPKFPSEEMVLIQGIIDAWFMEGDDIILMDYKTDKVKEASELIHRYQIQLDLYKRAIEATTGKKVKEIYIYSFGLGCQIKM